MSVHDESNVADLNIERLLSQAYHPEAPDADFQRRVEERLLAVASHGRPTVPLKPTPAEATRLSKVRFRLGLAMAVAAAVAGVALIPHILRLAQRPGQTGQVAKSDADSSEVLTPKTRPPLKKAPEKAVVGDAIETRTGERRLVTLPDGSVLYINQNTRVSLDATRQVTLTKGEVFVEVAPKGKQSPFVVKAAGRDVTALGTKFAVKAGPDGKAGVVVTQGRVKVSGVDKELTSGQQLDMANATAQAAPRASAVLDWTRELMAAAESPLVPDSKYTGGALVAVDPQGQEAKLTLRNYTVDVHIEDGFARTIIDQTFFNQNHWRMEGTFYFPLPADAQLSRLAMYVDGQLMEGGMAERDYARSVYEEIVWSQKDPALLEWVDGSTFKMRVFPLEARQEKRLIIGYVQRLPSLYGRAQYRFPAGHSLGTVNDFAFKARVKHGASLGWSCDSHTLKVNQDGADLVLTAKEHGVKLDRDVALTLVDPTGGATSPDMSQFSSIVHEGYRYAMLRYRPQLPTRQERQQRDWVFLFESSGDRDPLLARVQVDIIRSLLANAEHYDTFAIVSAGTRVHTFRDEPMLVTPDNVQAAVAFLEQAHLIGALDLNQGLAKTESFLRRAHNPHLVHVGSGIAALGERRPDVLAKRIPDGTRYVGVGVGKRWSRDFMKAAAERTGGYFTQINPDEAVSWRAFELAATLNTPRLMNVQVSAGGQPWLLFGSTLAHGEELCAVTRLEENEALPTSVRVTGTLDGRSFTQEIPVAGLAVNAEYLPRAWAKLEIDRLLADHSKNNRAAIIALSKAMYVMTPFTSLLVLENEDMYRRFRVDRGRHDHWAGYVTPQKIEVKYYPEVGQPVDARFAPKTAKPHANQILQTIQVRVPPTLLTWAGRHEPFRYQTATTALQVYRGAFAVPHTGAAWGRLPDRRREAEAGEFELPSDPAPKAGEGRLSLNEIGYTYLAGQGQPGFAPTNHPVSRLDQMQESSKSSAASYRGRVFYEKRTNGANRGLTPIDGEFDVSRIRGESRAPMIPQADVLAFDDDKPSSRGSFKNDGADALLSELTQGRGQGPRMYTRPGFGHQPRVFFDLVSYAPGMTTTLADIKAVVEAEALPDKAGIPGIVDAAAHQLIDRARTAEWHSLTVGSGSKAYTVLFDGRGRYAYERVLPLGLKEQVICDGTTLLHLYPELGVGARRTVSRFHRAEFAELVPWLVPPAEDLARGADVRAIGERVVAVVPRDAADARDDDGKPVPYARIELHFNAEGRLAERRIVQLPGDKLLFRESYDAQGMVRLEDGKGKELSKRDLKIAATAEPSLTADTSKLVVLPLPYREINHTWRQHRVWQTLYNEDEAWTLAYLDTDTALALFATEFGVNNLDAARRVYELCFAVNGVRRAGFFTLLAACGMNVASHPDFLALQEAEPTTPVLGYLALHSNRLYGRLQQRHGLYLGGAVGSSGSFLHSMSTFHDLYLRWHNSAPNQDWLVASRRAEEQQALDFVAAHHSSLGWAMLTLLQDHADNPECHEAVAAAYQTFGKGTDLSYVARYEHARSLFRADKSAEAIARFRELFRETLKAGAPPLLDHSFRNALQSDERTDHWTALMRETAERFLADGHRADVVALAWQCYQLGDEPLAEMLLATALKAPKDDAERLRITLLAVEFLTSTSQWEKADNLIRPLLDEAQFAGKPMLWRLAGQVAQQRGLTARSIACLERTLDIEYRALPEVINLQQVREEYGRLLQHYEWLAGASAAMQIQPPKDLLAHVIKAADRWRALDRDGAQPCEVAARVLRALGARDLAWEYLTTPIAMRPNESDTWRRLAFTMSAHDERDLADRAFRAAADADPTDASLLWDRAQNLRSAGKLSEAHKLLRQIVSNSWDRRFQDLKSKARWQLEGR